MSQGYERDEPVKRGEEAIFEPQIDASDRKAMTEYKGTIVNETMILTGVDVKARLTRIEAEIERMSKLTEHLLRLRSITRGAVLGTTEDES